MSREALTTLDMLRLSLYSVVIVNYNTRADLLACLEALHTFDPMPEIIVVDNASSDGSADIVAKQFPEVFLLAPGWNTWFCGGNNLGSAVARSKYVLLLNPDTIPNQPALDAMLSFIDANPQYAGVTVQMRYPDGGIQRTCSQVPSYRYLLLNHTVIGWLLPGLKKTVNAEHWYEGWERDSDRDVDVPPGSCLFGLPDDLRLDENLLLYFPEDDLGQRHGTGKFRFLGRHHIIHREKSATRTWNATAIYFRDLFTYTRQHHGWTAMAALWLLSRPVYWGMWMKRHWGEE